MVSPTMFARSVAVWFVLLLVAFINGALRETWLIPRIGDTAGRAASTIILSCAILLLSWMTIGWIHPAARSDAFIVGITWVILTLAFEFVGGHYAFHKSWPELLVDYNIFAGRIWILALLTTLLAPFMTAHV